MNVEFTLARQDKSDRYEHNALKESLERINLTVNYAGIARYFVYFKYFFLLCYVLRRIFI